MSGETWLRRRKTWCHQKRSLITSFPNTFLKFNMSIQNNHVWKELPFQITIFSIHKKISWVSLLKLCPRCSFSPCWYDSDWCSTCRFIGEEMDLGEKSSTILGWRWSHFILSFFGSQVVRELSYQQYGWEFPGIFTRASLSTCLWIVAKIPNQKKHRLSSPKLKTWLPSALWITNRLMRWSIDHYSTQSLEIFLIRKTENETNNGIHGIYIFQLSAEWPRKTPELAFLTSSCKNVHQLPPVASFPHLGSW